jgi:phage protein U
VALISHKGLPRPIAVKGLALPGESGSLLVRSNGNIVGLYVMSFLSFNRTYFMPASAIRLVLRGYETKG